MNEYEKPNQPLDTEERIKISTGNEPGAPLHNGTEPKENENEVEVETEEN